MDTETTFLRLLKTHDGIISKICRLYADGAPDREDLAQEIAYQLWRSFPSFRGESKAATWIYRVALNTAMARFRKRGVSLFFPGKSPEPTEDVPENDDTEALLLAIRRLPPGERALVSLYLEDLSYREIGHILGVSESNVGVKLHRAKEKLKKIIRHES